jgi:hypothetical protein
MAKETLASLRTTECVDYPVVNGVLSELWQRLGSAEMPLAIVKRVYSVATECLENIQKYADCDISTPVVFCIDWDGDYVYIRAVNALAKSKVPKLEYSIDLVNSLGPIELKKLFKHKIQTRQISELGGAGLGFIIMARKVEGGIDYCIREQESGMYIFDCKMKIIVSSTHEE